MVKGSGKRRMYHVESRVRITLILPHRNSKAAYSKALYSFSLCVGTAPDGTSSSRPFELATK